MTVTSAAPTTRRGRSTTCWPTRLLAGTGSNSRRQSSASTRRRDSEGVSERAAEQERRLDALPSAHALENAARVAGGSRVAIVFNGSPLFTGDAGSGPSDIRQWIIENDWLEAIIALPDQLFYNTGISTYTGF